MAALRDRTFFSVPELNREIRKKLEELNERPFQKRPGSRRSVFLEEERDFLFPLPARPFEIAVWKQATVSFNYHVQVEGNFYSVCHEYIKQKVDVRITSRMVEIFYNGVRICSPPRVNGVSGQYRTVHEHMRESHAEARVEGGRFISGLQARANTEGVIRGTCRMQVETAGFRHAWGSQDGGQELRRTLETLCEGSFLHAPSHKQEHPGDSQIRAGQASSVRRACQESGRPAQLHPGRGILRGWTGC
jgi:hypothetical protein